MKTRTLSWALTALRIVIGWYFLYEGIDKLLTPGWTSKMYLMESRWIFAEIFHQMASNPGIIRLVDFLNIWGLILIGLSLFTGLWVRWSSIAGALLLLFYFVAHPPIPGYTFGAVTEGSYIWINKTLILMFIMVVFAFLPSDIWYGIDRLISRWKMEKPHAPIPPEKETASLQRRELLRDLISIPFFGAFAYAAYKKRKWDTFEEKFLTSQPDATSGATIRSFHFTALDDLKGTLPKGKIGNLDFSRLIMGGNLIGGWAHSRDLIYTSKLVKAYHSDERVMMTLQLAEKCGINAIISNPVLSRIINKYWRETGGKIQFISDCGGGGREGEDRLLGGIRASEEAGASAMYIIGNIADRLVQEGNYEKIAEALELIRSYGKPAGIGAHLLDTVQGCVKMGIKPDYWVKSLHHHNYWSAQVDLNRELSGDLKLGIIDPNYNREIKPGITKVNNMYCYNPQETIDFMNTLEEPWIAFKVLAAGAIHPEDAFGYAFENGADFICVGMYDFQIVEDCNIALDVLNSNSLNNRTRSWMA
jgi:uncharacterized membrane protein YphA (DoxX/SURF4 family)